MIILEDDPMALVYADAQHGFVLPPGRFVRADQIAGRVFEVTATPHLTSLTSAGAVTLADSVAHLLEHAGWARATTAIGAVGIGVGARAAVAEAVQGRLQFTRGRTGARLLAEKDRVLAAGTTPGTNPSHAPPTLVRDRAISAEYAHLHRADPKGLE